MTLENQIKLGQFRNWVRSSIGLRCLRDGLLDYVTTSTEDQYKTFVKYLKRRAKISTFTCDKCQLCNLLPLHALEKKRCNQRHVNYCNCKRQSDKRVCPEGGACGIFYDCVTDEHFEHDPSWCNTSVELWSTNSFEFMKCFISTPGYKNKRSISLIDASGLISICLNNRRLRASFNDISDLLKKVKDYRNDILHSGDLKVSNDRLKEYLKDMKQILQHSELEENEAAQKELKTLERLETDELAITSQDDINMRKDALKAIIEREIELKLNLSEEDTLRTEVKTPFTSDSDKRENMPLTKDDETDVKTILTAGVKDKIEKELAQLSVAEEKHYNSIETTLQKVENEIIKVKETVRTHRSDLDEIKTGLLSQQNVLRSLSEEQQRQSKVLEETYDLVGDVHATGKETHSATLSTQKAVLESSNEVREILERVRRIDAQTTVPEQRLTVKITKTDRNGEKELSQRLVDICNSIVNMETIPPEKRTQIRHCLTMALNEIGKDGNEITAFKPECLAIYVRCKSLQTWVDLCEKCLAHELTQAFKAVENEVRRLTGLENVQLDVVIYEEDFLKSVNAIVASTNTDVARTLQTSSGRKRYQICFTFESSSDSDESSTARDEPTSNDNMMTGDFLDDVDDNEDSCEIEKELIEIEHLEHQNKELQMTQEDVKDTFVCNSCKNKFRTSAELSDHQAKYSNMNNFLSEERLKWTQRSPPRGVKLEKYTLCERFSKKKACPYGDKCIKPHTDCELTEWNQSLESMRQLILHIGENVEDLSLGYSLYKMCKEEKQMKATKPELDFVRIDALSELKVHTITKRFKNSWPFEIKSEYSLKRVCLTDQEASTYYNIENITDTTQKKDVCYDRSQLKDECQEWTNPKFVFNRKGQYKYKIKVAFQTEIYGTFCQNIIFDFGKSELILKQLAVESAPVTSVDEVRGKFEKQCKRRWQEEDVNVVKFFERTDEDERGIGLKKQYPLEELLHKEFPDSLSRENYTAWMHMMLYAEEQARLEEISKFNIKTSLVLEDRLEPIDNPTSETLFANDGELLARIGLNDELSVDSIAGKLILRQSHMIWIAPVTIKRIDAMTKMSVYEARIEHRERDFIDVELSRQSVEELGLQCRQEFEVEIQFQLDRILFWEMHRAVDNLRQLDFVFPPLLNTKDFQKATSVLERRFVNKGMDELNPNQMTAVVKSSCTLKSATPPFLIVGPYGTGKTYTIAQAVKYIIKQSSKSRVLISTCSNSEADAYIKDYMHPFVETGNPEARPLRIYYRYRWRSTVSETVLAYCLLEEEGEHKGTFRSPTKDELLQHRVIVTTLHTAKLLTYLELTEDVFTHIFIDEAAQALECDLLIPLSLAGPNTRIILAGDHMQLSPDVYSKIGQQEQFQMSMLERLVEYYIVDSPFVVTLCDNYRSTKEIIDFTSALFYDNRLKAVKNPPQHSVYYPLTFFTARGKEIMPDLKTGYYNESEVYEVVDQVEHFYQYWPPEWGKFDGKSICVVSTYKMQIWCIRAELRKRDIHNVAVEMVTNVQGKQFRVIIMSTVRTKHTCSVNTVDTVDNDDYDLGFLSNIKLLNTVITRAQSLVIVIGDPVALCLIGRCSKVWEFYLEMCNEHASFFGLTWKHFKMMLENAEVEETYRLNPLAKEFVPRSFIDSTRAPPNSPVSTAIHHPQNTKRGYPLKSTTAPPISVQPKGKVVKTRPMPSFDTSQYGLHVRQAIRNVVPSTTRTQSSLFSVPTTNNIAQPIVKQSTLNVIKTRQTRSTGNIQLGFTEPQASRNILPSTTRIQTSWTSVSPSSRGITVQQALPSKTQHDPIFRSVQGYYSGQGQNSTNPYSTLFKHSGSNIAQTSTGLLHSQGMYTPESHLFMHGSTHIPRTSNIPLSSQGSSCRNTEATEFMRGRTATPEYLSIQEQNSTNPDSTLFKPSGSNVPQTSISLLHSQVMYTPEPHMFMHGSTHIPRTSINPFSSRGSSSKNTEATKFIRERTDIQQPPVYQMQSGGIGGMSHVPCTNLPVTCCGLDTMTPVFLHTSPIFTEQHAHLPTETAINVPKLEPAYDLSTARKPSKTSDSKAGLRYDPFAFTGVIATSTTESTSTSIGHNVSNEMADIKRRDNPQTLEAESLRFGDVDFYSLVRQATGPISQKEKWCRTTDDDRLESVRINRFSEAPPTQSKRKVKNEPKIADDGKLSSSILGQNYNEGTTYRNERKLNQTVEINNPDMRNPHNPRETLSSGTLGIVKPPKSSNKTDDQKAFSQGEITSQVSTKVEPANVGSLKFSYAEMVKRKTSERK